MTVCVGICSEEGVVLAADSQITAGRSRKTYAPKLTQAGNGKRFGVGLAGSGYKDLMDLGLEDVKGALTNLKRPTTKQIRSKIERELALLAGMYPEEIQEQEWLCAISCPPDRVKLIRFWKYLPALTGKISIIGCGKTPLSDYLESWVSKPPSSNQEALRWAIFLIMQASKFVPGCGGPINATLLFNGDGKVLEKRPEETAQIEEELKQVHAELSDIFERVVIARPNQSEVEMSLNAFKMRMKEVFSKNNA